MDVIEAIDAWIDDCIDDLSDDELSQILEILDAVSASEFVDLEPHQLYDEDIDVLVEAVGGPAAERRYTEDVLRSAFFGDSQPGSRDQGDAVDTMAAAPDVEDTDLEDTDLEDTDLEDTDLEDTDLEDTDLEDTDLEDTDLEDADTDLGDAAGPASVLLADANADPEAETEIETETDVDSEPDRKPETDLDPELDEDTDLETDRDPHGEFELDSELDTDADAELDAELDEDTGLETDRDPHGEFELDSELDTDADAELDAEVVGDPDLEPDTDADADLDAEFDLDTDREPDTDFELDTGLELDAGLELHREFDRDLETELDTGLELDPPVELGTEAELDAGRDTELETDLDADLAFDADVDSDSESDFELDTEQEADAELDDDLDFDTKVEGRDAGLEEVAQSNDEAVIVLGDGPLPESAQELTQGESVPAGAIATQEFIADLTSASATDSAATAVLPKIELGPGDSLGPSFLGSGSEASPTPEVPSSGGWRRLLVPVLLLAGLGVFAFGTIQLFGSLNDEEQPIASADPAPEATVVATAEPVEAPTAAPSEANVAEPTATPVPDEPTRIAMRLLTGDVVLATRDTNGEPAAIRPLYNARNEESGPAVDITWIDGNLGVVNDQGDVLMVDLASSNPIPAVLYEAGDGVSAAAQIALVGDRVAVRTQDGDITLIPLVQGGSPESFGVVWDAATQGARVVNIDAIGELVPFVLDDGTAEIFSIDDDVALEDTVFEQMWSTEVQPPAANLSASSSGILLGVGQGAITRFKLGEADGARVEIVWDPFVTEDVQPAIAYSTLGDRAAVILGDGTLLLTDGNSPEVLWDPAETELRAFAAFGDSAEVIILLETGSIVSVPLNDDPIESIWDVTDETLSPAVQVALEPVTEPAS